MSIFYDIDTTDGGDTFYEGMVKADTNWGYMNTALNAAGKLVYASGTSYGNLTGLAIGTANYKLFTNAAASAPEWAKGIKYIASTRVMSAGDGDVSYTGVGFKPGAIIAIATVSGGNEVSIGMADISTDVCVYQTAATTWGTSANLIVGYDSAGNYDVGALKTADTDGFTITWAATGSPATTLALYFLCFR